jgi:hypothetical protein
MKSSDVLYVFMIWLERILRACRPARRCKFMHETTCGPQARGPKKGVPLLKDYNRMVLIASSAERALPWVKFDLGSLWPPFPFFWLVEAGGWVELIGVG